MLLLSSIETNKYMITAPRPDNEKARVENLYTYDIVDSLPEEEYDNITKIASDICGTPVSLITTMEEERQWIKSAVGTDVTEVPRDISFCSHLLTNGEDIIFKDLRRNADFTDHPMVAGPLQVGFYAGVPVFSVEGYPIATLCVLDNEPRELTEKQIKSLQALAKQVAVLLKLRKTLRQTEQLNRELQTANDNLESFNYMVTHDLKTPLREIRNYLEAVQEDFGEVLPEEVRGIFGKVSETSAHMDNLIEDLTKLSRIDNYKLKSAPINLTALCHELIAVHDGKKHEFIIAENLHTTGDKALIALALRNLIENAVKYSSNETAPRVEISETNRAGKNYFCVRDNGVGFAVEKAENIWQPFKRLHSKKEFKGTGIGLTIVKKATDKHGGEVFFQSKIGEGAAFFVRFE